MSIGTSLTTMFSPPPAEQAHAQRDTVLKIIKAGDNPLLVGPSGCGKTTLAKQVADQLSVPFYHVGKVTADFQLKGYSDAQGRPVFTNFRKAYEHGGLFLFDELDASEPDAFTSIHAALENGFLDAPDGMIPRHKDFYFIGAANTWGHGATLDYVGRNRLDGATLDRFAPIYMDYDEELERTIVHDLYDGRHDNWVKTVQTARAAARTLQLHHIVSMRASIKGAAMLEEGLSPEDAMEIRIFRGLNQDDRIKLANKMKESLSSLKDILDKAAQKSQSVTGILTEIKGTLDTFVELQKSQETIAKLSERAKAIMEDIKTITDAISDAETTAETAENLKEELKTIHEKALVTIRKYTLTP